MYRVNSTSEYSTTDTDHQITDEDCSRATSFTPHFSNKTKLSDIIGDLYLTKSVAELLTSRLGKWNLLGEYCRSTAYQKRHEKFSAYFTADGNLCYFKAVNGLLAAAIGIDHDAS